MRFLSKYACYLIKNNKISIYLPAQIFSHYSTDVLPLAAKWKIKLDTNVESKLQSDGPNVRYNPGTRNVKCVTMPERLQKSLAIVLQNFDIKQLKTPSEKLVNYLAARKLPPEETEINSKAGELIENINEQRGDINNYPAEDRDVEAKRRKDILDNMLKKSVYHWKPIEYNAYKGLLYLIGRVAVNYAVLHRVLWEIKKGCPQYQPTTLFDFGSGIGSTFWAVNDLWQKSLTECYNVDISEEMNELARLLFQDGREDKEMFMKGIFFRQYLSPSNVVKFNLVVSAFSLLELPSIELRLKTIHSLWGKTEDFLILIEDGTNSGYELIMEARDFIHHLQAKSNDPNDIGHVFAPCPHDLPCPRFSDGTNTPCNFEVKYYPLKLTNTIEAVAHRFSYVIFKKGRKEATPTGHWPRIVRPVLCRGKHVVCRTCTEDGQLKELIITKSKHSRELYKCTRNSKWGDFLPIDQLELQSQNEVANSINVENETKNKESE